MEKVRSVHPHFKEYLQYKNQGLIELYLDLRAFILSFYPDCNELLYHTHALTSVYTVTEKLSDAFCMIPIYTDHLNFGFNKGTLLDDPNGLLEGTGKLIRHIPVLQPENYRNSKVQALLKSAIDLAIEDRDKPAKQSGLTISKIKL